MSNQMILLAGGEPSPTWSLSASSYNINEGDAVTITVITTNVPDGTVVNLGVIGESGFSLSNDLTTDTPSGQLTINNETASVTYYMSNDYTTEGTEQFRVGIYLPGASYWLKISDYITVNDTSVPQEPFPSSAVIIGGGGGGARFNGGGGAGAYGHVDGTLYTQNNYNIEIGAGGARSGSQGLNGGDTTGFGLTLKGGGGGGDRGYNTSPGYASGAGNPSPDPMGGSGGGASGYDTPPGAPGGTSGQYGRDGGPAYNGPGWSGSGGGGAGGSGQSHQSGSIAGHGGSGSTIPSVLGGGNVCGGGGGGNYDGKHTGLASHGGGFGWSPRNPAPPSIDGDNGTGGGGGGCSHHGPGSAGGSGHIRVSHPSGITATNPGGGLSFSVAHNPSTSFTTIYSGSGTLRFVDR